MNPPWQTFDDPAGDPFVKFVAMDDGPIYRLDEAALIEADEKNAQEFWSELFGRLISDD